MKNFKMLLSVVSRYVAMLALGLAVITGNATCFYCTYQPEEPACLKNIHFCDLLVRK